MNGKPAIDDLFVEAMDFVWEPGNDGQPFHVSPNDPGGATAWGVTFSTWASWQQLHGLPASFDAFRVMAKTAFLPLYRALFWNACRCSMLGPIGIQLFDAAVNCGPGHAAQFLQAAVGVNIDGMIGPVTVAAAAAFDQRALSRLLCSNRDAFYAKLPAARYFERGWDARAEACRDLVLTILRIPATWPVAENGHPQPKET